MISSSLLSFIFCILTLVVTGSCENTQARTPDPMVNSRKKDHDRDWHRALNDAPTANGFTPSEGESQCPVCQTPPEDSCPSNGNACPLNYAPVCGCDSITYENRCIATVLNCVPCVNTGVCPDPRLSFQV